MTYQAINMGTSAPNDGETLFSYFTKADAMFSALYTGTGTTSHPITDVASDATCDIGAAATDRVRITGTTTITSFGTSANKLRFVHFSGALLLTHNATSLILPGGVNKPVEANDCAIFSSDASGNWRCLSYLSGDDEAFSVKDFGAIGDGVTNDRTAFQLAITTAIADGHRMVRVPAGTYFIDGDSASLNPGTGVTVVGEGSDRTIIVFDEEDSGGTARPLFVNSDSASGKKHIEFRGITFRGTMFDGAGQDGTWSALLENYPSATVADCRFEQIACIGFIFQGCDDVQILNNEYEDMARGSIRVTNARKITVDGNLIERGGDDPMSLHVGNSAVASDSPSIGEAMIVTNNTMRACTGSIKALGARVMTISDNILQLTHGIQVGDIADASEGSQQPLAINICDNILLDTVRMESGGIAATQVIGVYATDARGSAGTNSTIPTQWNSTAGAFVYPWDHRDSDRTNSAHALAPVIGLRITGNIIARTLPSVADVDDYGYGDPNYQGTYLTTTTTDAIMRPGIGINVDGDGTVGVDISNNVIMNVGLLIQLEHSTVTRAIKVEGNVCFDSPTGGINWTGGPGSQETHNVTIANNTFNIDPYRLNANSNTDGTYDANGSPLVFANTSNIAGMHIHGNQFINSCQIMGAASLVLQNWHANTAFIDPTALGFSASNQGIGNIPNVPGIELAVIDGDPTSATYFQSFQRLERSSSAQPASGWYPIGWVVFDSSPATTSIGWIRLTTGTGHVAGTDWLEFGTVRGPSSATDNAIARFDATTGRLLQNSAATVDDNGTLSIPSGQGIELGHATDTTITRSGAGDVAIEGNVIYRAGGTDVALADGGTGASTAAAARTNLDAQQRCLYAASGAAVSVGATTAETVLATVTIPANSLGANGSIYVETGWTVTNGADDKTERIRFGAQGAGTGGTQFKAHVLTTVATLHDGCSIHNRNATNSQVGGSASGLVTNFGTATGALPTGAIDTTAATDVIITGQKETSGDTLTLEWYKVWVWPSS